MNDRYDDNIPLVSNWQESRLFSDLDDARCVDNFGRMLDGWQGNPPAAELSENVGSTVEATIGEWNTVPAGLLHLLAEKRNAVARITVPSGRDFRGINRPNGWKGTGFLVSPNLLLTNHHVLHDAKTAQKAIVEFGFELPPQELFANVETPRPAVTQFKPDPARLFLTSPLEGTGLDYSFVWISDEAATQFGFIEMSRGSFTINRHEPTFIIHHPDGRLKEASLDDTELLSNNATAVLYAADTQGGSSGAPVFDKHGKLVALHHAWHDIRSHPQKFHDDFLTLQNGKETNIANEGIKISAIAIQLEQMAAKGGLPAAPAARILQHIKGSDTLTGVFGGLGRFSGSDEREESVVNIYKGTERDIDVAFWNVEWLSRTWKQPGKLARVATVIADLNADIWGLVEISPDAVKALIEIIETKFGEKYEAAFSEPDAADSKQSTAVIWRISTVQGRREEWPADIEKMWHLKSRDDLGLEALHGKIFNRYPGLFCFESTSSGQACQFYLVPVHLKAMGEGQLRRRLASKLLAHAVNTMINEHGYQKDWIIGGDWIAPLASKDFVDLSRSGFIPLAAEDEAAGGFSYLKSPRTLIDNIFVSQNMSLTVNSDDFFIVAKDRSVDKFVKQLSDHRPIVMRLSLNSANGGSRNRVVDNFDSSLPDSLAIAEHLDDGSASSRWESKGLSKPEFMRRNATEFNKLIARVNRALAAQYDGPVLRLNALDQWVITYVEAGFRNGLMDPHFVHSLGEQGLFPLPSNIRYWNGKNAPAWDKPMSLATNLYQYALYLGQLKNKSVRTVGIGVLYRDLFQFPGIAQNTERQAKLLAGIVHGYFVSSNYGDRIVPFRQILDGFAADLPVDEILRTTRYVYAGNSILSNRQANIRLALKDYHA